MGTTGLDAPSGLAQAAHSAKHETPNLRVMDLSGVGLDDPGVPFSATILWFYGRIPAVSIILSAQPFPAKHSKQSSFPAASQLTASLVPKHTHTFCLLILQTHRDTPLCVCVLPFTPSLMISRRSRSAGMGTLPLSLLSPLAQRSAVLT